MDVFVYGTLTDREAANDILDSFAYRGEATLSGLHRVDGHYPTLLPGGETTGRVLETTELDALDRYEGVDSGLYVRVTIPRNDGGTVDTYVGDPDRLGVDEEWPGTDPFAQRVEEYLKENEVVVRVD